METDYQKCKITCHCSREGHRYSLGIPTRSTQVNCSICIWA